MIEQQRDITPKEIMFDERPGNQGNLGIITLNRPKSLNSINHDMIKAMYKQLQIWANAEHIKCVVIRAADGRAFCAGGDLRLMYDRFFTHDPALPKFFWDEYQLNRYIYHYPKPYIALLDGITMGGGVGISIHGSHRVATDRLVFAMPETGIGFFPDVGGTYFLPRLSGFIGFYCGLTGAKMNCDDAVALGIAQVKVSSGSLNDLITALADRKFDDHAKDTVTHVISEFKQKTESSNLMHQKAAIDECFSKPSVEEIMNALQTSSNAICKEANATIAKKSPMSLKITLKALQEGKQMDFDFCMRQEFRLTWRFLEGHDFLEGIRAVIIDKDQNPQWMPAKLEDVSSDEVNKYFAPLSQELV